LCYFHYIAKQATKGKGNTMNKLELTTDQLMVIIKALEMFDPEYIKDWDLDGIEAGEEKDDYLNELLEQVEKAGN